MSWGAGPALGLLTFCGYLLFLWGAAVMWRNRSYFLLWMYDEISFFHRSFSRFTPAGPFYIPLGLIPLQRSSALCAEFSFAPPTQPD